jgi:Protein of unknown function (DUF3572)
VAPRSPDHNSDLEAAETIGLEAMAVVTEDGVRLHRFLSSTGLSPEQLRVEASAPQTLQAVLEHLAEDEALLLVFAATPDVRPKPSSGREPCWRPKRSA